MLCIYRRIFFEGPGNLYLHVVFREDYNWDTMFFNQVEEREEKAFSAFFFCPLNQCAGGLHTLVGKAFSKITR